MTAAAPLAFPGSRSLAGWWRQLAPWHPRSLAVAHLLLHRVEALVRQTRPVRPDRLLLLVLEALDLEVPAAAARIQESLPLDRATLGRLLRQLEADGLARREPNGGWRLTDLGRQARRHGEYPRAGHDRRAFYFLESGQPERPPRFLNLHPCATTPWAPADGWTFDVRRLTECVGRPAEWKERHGFPREVEEVLAAEAPAAAVNRPAPEEARLAAWRRVVVDQPERLPAVLVRTAGERGEERLLGFAVAKAWTLNPAAPALSLGGDWREVFPELASDPGPDAWRQAWRAWGQVSGLSAAETDACLLERRDHRLRVTAARGFLDRLRGLRPEVFKGEAWLLAGGDRFRSAAAVEVVDGSLRR